MPSIGLNFRDNPASIDINSTASADFNPEPSFDDNLFGLRVPDGKTFALAGGDITADGGGIVAVGGRIELGAVVESGTVGLNFTGDNISFDFPDDLARANISLINNAGFLVSGSGGGDIAITANNIGILEGSGLFAGIFSGLGSVDAQAGDITINASSVSVIGESSIDSRTSGLGNAGNIFIEAQEITFSNSNIFTEVSSDGGEGDAGDINITTNSLLLQNGSAFLADTENIGNAGDITIDARDQIVLEGEGFSQITSTVDAGTNSNVTGNAGNIEITTGSLSITDGGFISTSTFGNGNGGKITINASNSVSLGNGGTIDNDISGEGNAGNIVINTDFLKISTSNITSSVFGKGNAGNIDINASESVEISGDILTDDGEFGSPGGILNQVERDGEGQGGNLTIETPLLNVSNGGKVQVATFGNGNPGNLSINATEINVFNTEDSNNQFATGIFAGVLIDPRNEQFARGEATNLTIDTEILSIRGGAEVSAETSGIGNGSNIFINATELVEIVGTDNKNRSPSNINAQVGSPDLDTSVNLAEITRNGGNITIDTNQLSIKDGGQISASNFTAGNAGNINIFSSNIEVDGGADGLLTGLFAQVGENATGKGGNLNLGNEQSAIEQLDLTNGAQISVSTFGQGNAGNLTIFTEQLMLKSGGELQATSFGNGNAGNLTVNAFESIKISGTAVDGSSPTGIFASAFDGTGNGGNLTIATDQLIVQDQGTIAVGNFQIVFGDRIALPSGTGVAGNLDIAAKSIEVDNGTITARNAIGIGGEIAISAESLLLKNGALIEASTTSEEGKGGSLNFEVSDNIFLRNESLISVESVNSAIAGDIKIDTNFIVAFPNSTPGNGSDIIANATEGDGGNINITAESLLGIEERTANPGNETNDIDASSDFGLDGTISIFTPDTTVIQGTTEIPNNIITPEQSLAQACSNNRNTSVASSFTIKGKGGVPPLPDAPMGSEIITVNGEVANNSNNSYAIPTSYGYIIPARGAIKTADGKIILTATPVSGSASRDAAGSLHCGS